MNYTFKLSRRVARFRPAVPIAAAFLTLSCAGDPSGLTSDPGPDPAFVTISPDSVSLGVNQAVQFNASTDATIAPTLSRSGKGRGRKTVVSVAVAPQSTTVSAGASNRFSATAMLSDGSNASPSLSWTATGGRIDQTGLYAAGTTAGTYRVIAAASNGIADTAAVTVAAVAPVAAQLVMTPTTDTLAEGATAQFAATGKASDGTTVGVSPLFTATGGSVTPAGVYTAGQTAGTYRVIATDRVSGLADTSGVTITPPPVVLQSIALSPTTVTLASGATRQFTASGMMSDSSTVPVAVTWSASGGTISSTGFYTAGSAAGTYRVIGTQPGGPLADTSTVTITVPSPTLQAVVLTPASVTLGSGATQQFAVSGRMSDGSTTTVNATYSATGGTITSGGLYTAGATAGVFRVIAVQQGGGFADSASVTVTTTTPPPPPPTGSCARTVNVNTTAELNSAIGASLPGDCIELAPGTYARSSSLTLSRSGTAANPITIQGAGASATVLNFGGSVLYVQASYLRIRKLRLTNFGVQPVWATGATYNVFDSLEIDHSRQALMRFKDGSHHNTVQNSWLHHSGQGIHPEWGEAIYVGNSGDSGFPLQFTNTDNQILNNHFGPYVTSQAVDVKEGSDRTVIRGNFIDGTGTMDIKSQGSVALIDVIASHVVIDNNQLQYGSPQGIVFWGPKTVTMTGNIVTNNTIDLENTHNVDFATRKFYGFNRSGGTTSSANVVVRCNNKVTNGAFSNVACTP